MRILISFVLAFTFSSLLAQNFFEKQYDLAEESAANSITATSDNGFALTGYVKINGTKKAMVMRLNAKGDTTWYKNNLFSKNSTGNDIIETSTGDFIITGVVSNSHDELFILKLSSSGSITWSKTYSKSTTYTEGFAVAELLTGGFVVAGTNYSTINGNDFLVLKTDSMGDTTWSKTIGGAGYDEAHSVIALTTGDIVVGGHSQSFGAGGYDGYLVKLSSSGTVIWSKTYGKNLDEKIASVILTADQGFLMCGQTISFGNNEQFYLVKTNSAGDTLWTQVFGGTGTDISTACAEAQDGGYVLSGYTNSFDPSAYDYYMIKTDPAGKKQWEKTYGFPGYYFEYSYDMVATQTGDYMLCGSSKPYFGYPEVYLVKTDMTGCSPHKPITKFENTPRPGIFCDGTPAKLYFPYAYQTYLWSNGDPGDFIMVDASGDYHAQVTDMYGCITYSDTVSLTKMPKPSVKITANGPTVYCPGSFDSVTLFATTGYPHYRWNLIMKDSLSSLLVTQLGKNNVMVTDSQGCTNTASVNIRNYAPFQDEKICVITVDSFTNKNLIAWERTGGQNTDFYKIYKETTQSGVYQEIGQKPFNKVSVFVDRNSYPKVKSDRYKITAVDSCGSESDLAKTDFHKTMHLTANKGTAGEINLIWEHYEGLAFQTYKIYRGISPHYLQLLDSIQSTNFTYTDQNPPANTAVYYQVAIVMPDTCTPTIIRAKTTSGPFTQSLSNLKDYGISRPDYMTVAPQSQTLEFGNDVATFYVYTNLTDWQVNVNASWVNITKNIGDGYFECNSDVNFGSSSRTADMTITANGVDSVTVQIIQEPVSGIVPIINEPEITVYPNPVNDKLNIDLMPSKDIDLGISVFNMLGEQINLTQYQSISAGKHHFETRTESLQNNSVYILKIQIDNKIYIRKFIKL